jgi:hypothetical protein
MEARHYGVTVDSERPTTGVLLNTEPEFLLEDVQSGIDIEWEEYCADCESRGEEPDGDEFTGDPSTVLVGFKESPLGADVVRRSNCLHYLIGRKAFVADPDAEYQAVVSEVYTQVLWSRFVQRTPLCSPCYPGQGDLDTPVGDSYSHDGFLAYTLPPAVWGDRKDWRKVSQYCITRGEVLYV